MQQFCNAVCLWAETVASTFVAEQIKNDDGMKKLVFILVSLMCVSVAYAKREKKVKADETVQFLESGGVKFHIEDKDEPLYLLDEISGQQCWEKMLNSSNIASTNYNIRTHSAKDSKMVFFSRNTCFEGFLTAYDKHYSLVLSPDIIWMLISQGIGTQINEHAEHLRNRLVDFEGQRTLKIETYRDVLENEEDWNWIIPAFSDSIDRNMKAKFSDLMVCNFSTTGNLERIASQITMMESVKKFFKYEIHYMGCGIPNITLLGTPDDWKEIRSRISRLDDLDLEWWRKELEPVLDEFVNASEGKINRKFWLDMVQQYSPARAGTGGCGGGPVPATYNGWFTVFFPFYEEDPINGPLRIARTPKIVSHNTKVCSEVKKAPVRYVEHLADGREINHSLELWAGFIGMELDSENCSLKPSISWMVREEVGFGLNMDGLEQAEIEFLKRYGDGKSFITSNEIYEIFGDVDTWIFIGFPESMLAKYPNHSRKSYEILSLDPITVPSDLGAWCRKLGIIELTVKAPMTDEQKADILSQFPTAVVVQL